MMASFFPCFKHITASDIDSGAATDGQVLTADGAGNSAWEAASGGGASFAWDDAEFTATLNGEYTTIVDVSIQLKKDGAPVEVETILSVFQLNPGSVPSDIQVYDFSSGISDTLGSSTDHARLYVTGNGGLFTFKALTNDPTFEGTTVYLCLALPTGGIKTSAGITGWVAD